jgi:gluconolactonase
MKKTVLLVSLITILAASPRHAQMPGDHGVVIRLDPALDPLVSADAKLDLVKNDCGFTEGVVCVDEGKSGYLLLSDMYANVIYKVTPEGKVSLYLDHSGYTGYDIWRVGMPQPDANRKDVFFMIG